MRRSVAAVAIWLALGAGAAALARHELSPGLAPSADTELADDVDLGLADDVGLGEEADIEPGEEPPWERVTPEHSHSVLKELVSKDAAKELKKGEMLDAELDPAAPAAPELVIDEVPRPEHRQQAPPGQEGLCAGMTIYDGPTAGWEDCRTRCVGHCKFWSFWHDSVQHRCKLTMDCDRRERDGRNVSAYRRALDAAGEEETSSQAAWDSGMTPLDPEPQQASAPPRAADAANKTTCSPQGSARKFGVSPQSGWHNLGKARTFASCANATLSRGYKNLVWNLGSIAKGRCYGFSSDMPDVLEANCEETYCWLFGTASPACQNLTGGTAEAEADKVFDAEPLATKKSTEVVIAGAELTNSSNEGELHETMDSKKPLGPQEEQGKPKRAMQKIKELFKRMFRPARATANVNDSVEAEARARYEANPSMQTAEEDDVRPTWVTEPAPQEAEVNKSVDVGSPAAQEGSRTGVTAAEFEAVMTESRKAEPAGAEVNDSIGGESQAPQEAEVNKSVDVESPAAQEGSRTGVTAAEFEAVMTESRKAEPAGAEVNDSIGGESQAMMSESKKAEPAWAEVGDPVDGEFEAMANESRKAEPAGAEVNESIDDDIQDLIDELRPH